LIICIVSSAQPSANPRVVKEATSLLNAGYDVSVIWCPISPWADRFDQELFQQFPTIKWIMAGYHSKKQPLSYWYAQVRQKCWKFIYRLIGNRFDAAIKSLVLYSQELKSAALKVESDIFIGHNLGALPAIVNASKKFNIKTIFDFEDFHRGEFLFGTIKQNMVVEVENNYIPYIYTITTASPAITEAYHSIFPEKSITTINNVFQISYAIGAIKVLPAKPLKLFWFSQYIGKKRGLENIIQAIASFNQDDIQLTLLGSCSTEIKNYFSSLAEYLGLSYKQIIFLEPVEESQIVQLAAEYHIGIASEIAHIHNRDLCLTNKIFMYLLAGNALVISNTKSQLEFIESHPGIGMKYEQDSIDDLQRVLSTYIENPELLNEHRANSLQLAKKELNWDIEKNKFLKVVNQYCK